MKFFQLLFVVLLSIFYMTFNAKAFNKFTNVDCEAFDKPFADFKECKLRVVGRGIIALAIHVRLMKVPVGNVTINLSLHKKYNGFRPFMFNQTANFCRVMGNRDKSPSFLNIFFSALLKDTNINHSCPYDHDIIVNDMIMKEEYLRFMPLPSGEYKFKLRVAAYNDWKATVSVTFLRRE